MVEEKQPLSIIDEELIPALDRVGKGFEKGTVFLPQLLMSADAAKEAFAVLKDKMAAEGKEKLEKRMEAVGYHILTHRGDSLNIS